ncbi:NF038120 family PEP-CTERM protein [Janthinobacterium sp. B9-8]|uniref:NF038120 family PEP-CTERM protein n=1 Tax=Janthinobacterium sp. B9-8 TaxID=1236179 RepID=UPI00061CEB44|nr:NF038120 family PEP-CTERM protein [Janthinobacterium sp. B9-8]AMC35462.1 hypothetical protein VN23_12985 [Janthinobacterium sp. B9-8]
MKQSLKMALLVAAIGLSMPAAQASIINFDSLKGDIFEGGDIVKADPLFNLTVLGDGMAGAIASASTCSILDCPSGNNTPYYLGLNDGGLQISNQLGFKLSSFSSSFASPLAANLPFSVANLIVSGTGLRGETFSDRFTLSGQNTNGNWTFSDFQYTASNRVFKTLSFAACLTTVTGECVPFSNNQAQFAIDNINVAAVPEPAEWLLMALGLAGITMVMRRKNKAQTISAGIAS